MRTIKEIRDDMAVLVSQIDGEEAAAEVEVEYVKFNEVTNKLLESEDIESYLLKYDEMCKEDNAVLECFNSTNVEDLKTYIEEKEISFDDLKTETVNATCEALKFLIYEAEDEEYG